MRTARERKDTPSGARRDDATQTTGGTSEYVSDSAACGRRSKRGAEKSDDTGMTGLGTGWGRDDDRACAAGRWCGKRGAECVREAGTAGTRTGSGDDDRPRRGDGYDHGRGRGTRDENDRRTTTGAADDNDRAGAGGRRRGKRGTRGEHTPDQTLPECRASNDSGSRVRDRGRDERGTGDNQTASSTRTSRDDDRATNGDRYGRAVSMATAYPQESWSSRRRARQLPDDERCDGARRGRYKRGSAKNHTPRTPNAGDCHNQRLNTRGRDNSAIGVTAADPYNTRAAHWRPGELLDDDRGDGARRGGCEGGT